jgi:riboflavin synthase
VFTGLVSAVARVVSVEGGSSGSRLTVGRPASYESIATGESIAVSGVCLTALASGEAGSLTFEVSPETLRRSTLGSLRRGDRVNLERALCASDRLGGHIVAGHVDATTPVAAIRDEGAFRTLTFALGTDWARYVVEKGSIALDGISLTVAALSEGRFDVAVIPHTFEETALGDRSPGDLVNVEVDVLGKYVERLLGLAASPEAGDERLRRLLAGRS